MYVTIDKAGHQKLASTQFGGGDIREYGILRLPPGQFRALSNLYNLRRKVFSISKMIVKLSDSTSLYNLSLFSIIKFLRIGKDYRKKSLIHVFAIC